ncbi:hypothetical protein GGR56DRAFT_208646 [Xylariaceae sp. FL0804]|nr:hypothetical protein GGR56DRAFT_208646 [Xylariaceae sp. FL0804]
MSKAPGSRNSEARKEQNRISSRAYREKRKQKLALLDEILNADGHTDSISSVSDEAEAPSTTTALSIPRSNHSSMSPPPRSLATAPDVAPWHATSRTIESDAPGLAHESYDDSWMQYYNHGASIPVFAPSNTYEYCPGPLDAHPEAMRPSPYYVSPAPAVTVPSLTTLYPQPPGENLPNMYLSPYQARHAPRTEPNTTIHYQDRRPHALDDDVADALESLSRLNDTQLQQVLHMAQRRRPLGRDRGHNS